MARDRKLISGVLLAAGAGSRFGGGKLLHPLEDGVAIAAHAARNLMSATGEVVAVVRWMVFVGSVLYIIHKHDIINKLNFFYKHYFINRKYFRK